MTYLEHARFIKKALDLYERELQTCRNARERFWLEVETLRLRCVTPTPASLTHDLVDAKFGLKQEDAG